MVLCKKDMKTVKKKKRESSDGQLPLYRQKYESNTWRGGGVLKNGWNVFQMESTTLLFILFILDKKEKYNWQ